MSTTLNKAIIPQTVFDYTEYYEEQLSYNAVIVSLSKYPKLTELINTINKSSLYYDSADSVQ